MTHSDADILIVIPCLNEERHIGALLGWVDPVAEKVGARILVVDGGSDDRSKQIVEDFMRGSERVALMDNPARIQSAGINLAVVRHGMNSRYMLRLDAHGKYPVDFCEKLLAEAEEKGADSVVVSMYTEGMERIQRANAAIQNSKLGTGGSKHRHGSGGEWVDHGHHALFRTRAFLAAGGYDENFSHNEDAELDHRLKLNGFRIWLSGRTHMIYYPRETFGGLFKQYMAYGRGRAKNLLKHRTLPSIRQLAPLLVCPALLLALGSAIYWVAAIPAVAWLGVCFLFGFWLAISERKPDLVLSAVSAIVMHFAWSLGFWRQLFASQSARPSA
ncbi:MULTISPECIES: glycosyltransferase family 2 protein [Mesorhizobium]|uniref:Glycosyltransferase n=1 Tax=Mesorhizobium denitrificans TaxID=2294114 RepID=A0A371X950_9HYPH|nr:MULTISPECIES: glycosyltransferase family 2 protein [Mesorhizobium]RFC65758.1 glycosyltransferase [Mesorhizobium denitrificans]